MSVIRSSTYQVVWGLMRHLLLPDFCDVGDVKVQNSQSEGQIGGAKLEVVAKP